MKLLACGLNHKTAPIDLRERFAITPEKQERLLLDFTRCQPIHEAAIISTCNRTEFYCTTEDKSSVLPWIAKHHQLALEELHPYIYRHDDHAAVQHLMRVACGLDSLSLGEAQILGQVKSAYQTACEVGTIGTQLQHIFQYVFSSTKRIRTDTQLGINALSIAHLGVDLAERIFANLQNRRVLLIGAGETIALTAKYMQEHGVTEFLLANRHQHTASSLIQSINAKFIGIGDIAAHLETVDIIVSATASPVPIIGKGLIERALKRRKQQPLFFIDLAMPRDIEPEAAQLPNVYLYNIDDLQQLAEQHLQHRENAAKQAEDLIELELLTFLQKYQTIQNHDIICAYRDTISQQCHHELNRALDKLKKGCDPEKLLQELTHRLCQKALHHPTLNLRKAASQGNNKMLDLARQLLLH